MKPAILVLEDGEVFEGVTFGSRSQVFGEVVFNTGMSGYQEVLTDPSYDGQIVAMTYPHIGNYGVNSQDSESGSVRVRGFVTRDLPAVYSSWRAEEGLEEYMDEHGVAGITEVDTRRLTRHIRERGAMRGAISTDCAAAQSLAAELLTTPLMAGANLTGGVSTTEPYEWPPTGPMLYKVAAYDFGMKHNILRELAARGAAVTVFPADTPASEVLGSNPDGVFISNGPGDPEAVKQGVDSIGRLLGKVPVFGICLGHQLMALALGLKTYKLSFGHRGANHPVLRLSDGAVQITTQNHGFSVRESGFGFKAAGEPGKPLPALTTFSTPHGPAELTHINLNDYTVEGFRLVDEPAFAVQYHPEAGPGPRDSRYLFDDFCALMKANLNPDQEAVNAPSN
ncbi:MAG: glutamine-hydrolyzing carbamoyl-phosphate synthase small subunit [Actinomycetota bacterium]